jgi:uncharacterized protein
MTEQEFDDFRQKLIDGISFPSVYMFKFIVASDNRSIALVESFFDVAADIHIKESGQGRYTSITAKQVVIDVDEIITVYKKASQIKGILFL